MFLKQTLFMQAWMKFFIWVKTNALVVEVTIRRNYLLMK